MKQTTGDVNATCNIKNKSKIRELWSKQVNKIKHGSYTCPLCKEAFPGLAAFGTHLKDHCT